MHYRNSTTVGTGLGRRVAPSLIKQPQDRRLKSGKTLAGLRLALAPPGRAPVGNPFSRQISSVRQFSSRANRERKPAEVLRWWTGSMDVLLLSGTMRGMAVGPLAAR
jgi:hypothetical protein